MNRRWGLVLVFLVGGCTSLLGDFSVGDGGAEDATGDVANDNTTQDVTQNDVVTVDAPNDVKDAPIDNAPPCGSPQEACCANNVCNVGQCCGTICLDTSNDPKNCGKCTHDCGGGNCKNSQCQPILVATSKSQYPGRIRDAQNNLVWMDRDLGDAGFGTGRVWTCAKQSCTPTMLIASIDYLNDIVLDGNLSTVFAANGSSKLFSCSITGCNQQPTTVTVGTNGGMNPLAYRNGNIFSSVDFDAKQFKTDGTGLVDLGSGNEPPSATEAPPGQQWVYWNAILSNTYYVRFGKESVANSAQSFWSSTTLGPINLLASDSKYIAWAGGNSQQFIYACPVGGASCNNPTSIASGITYMGYWEGALGMDPTTDDVLWTTTSSNAVNVYACAAASCTTPTLVASVTTSSTATAGSVIADPNFYYFNMSDGTTESLYRVAK
jgi:hypothetical protein